MNGEGPVGAAAAGPTRPLRPRGAPPRERERARVPLSEIPTPRKLAGYSGLCPRVYQSGERVDAFHAAGLRAGGRDNGAPGLRPHYHPGYYAAYLLDPDGNNIEAVCHTA